MNRTVSSSIRTIGLSLALVGLVGGMATVTTVGAQEPPVPNPCIIQMDPADGGSAIYESDPVAATAGSSTEEFGTIVIDGQTFRLVPVPDVTTAGPTPGDSPQVGCEGMSVATVAGCSVSAVSTGVVPDAEVEVAQGGTVSIVVEAEASEQSANVPGDMVNASAVECTTSVPAAAETSIESTGGIAALTCTVVFTPEASDQPGSLTGQIVSCEDTRVPAEPTPIP